jgi:hypothetical protein
MQWAKPTAHMQEIKHIQKAFLKKHERERPYETPQHKRNGHVRIQIYLKAVSC